MSDSSSNPLAAAAGNPPPGLSPQDRLSSYNGVPLTAALGVLAGLAFIFWSIRIYAKTIITRRIGWDDLVCTLGMVGALMDIVCFGIASIQGPLGKHIWNISLAELIGNSFSVPLYIMQVTASATLGLIKLTIFLFYLDIFWPLAWCRRVIYIGASLSSAFYLSITIVQFYFMIPRPGESLSKHLTAAEVNRLGIPTSAVGLAIDTVLLIVPLRALSQLQMAKKKKMRLYLFFLVGIMAMIGSILSLSFKIKTYGNSDLTYDLTLANFFVAVKMSLGICIASIPLVARAFKEHRSQLSSVAESLSSPFWRFGRTFTARSTIDHKSTAIYEVDHDSASSNGLVELGPNDDSEEYGPVRRHKILAPLNGSKRLSDRKPLCICHDAPAPRGGFSLSLSDSVDQTVTPCQTSHNFSMLFTDRDERTFQGFHQALVFRTRRCKDTIAIVGPLLTWSFDYTMNARLQDLGADRLLNSPFPVTIEQLREPANFGEWIAILKRLLSGTTNAFLVLDADLLAHATTHERIQALEMLGLLTSELSGNVKIETATSCASRAYVEELEVSDACIRLHTGGAADWRAPRRSRRPVARSRKW